MSLECEGHGGVCEECGQFDFLPTECPQCHRVLCQQHVRRHHPDATSDEWCSYGITGHNPNDITDTANSHDKEEKAAEASSSSALHCHVCGSEWCVLRPCPQCQKPFCAAHRFHGHEESADEARRRQPKHGPVTAAAVERGSAPGSSPSTDPLPSDLPSLAQQCQPFTAAACLTLAPPNYRSRMMPITALLVLRSAADEDYGVCSLSVATEATVGQLVERLVQSLALWRFEARNDGSVSKDVWNLRALQHTTALHIDPDASADPPLRLSTLPLGAITREVLTAQDVLLLHIGTADGEATSPLPSTALHGAVAAAVFASPQSSGARRDPRLQALATRLRLRAAAVSTRGRAGAGGVPAPVHSPPAPPQAEPSVAASDKSAAVPPCPAACPPQGSASPSADWPFRTPAPLTSFAFANTKSDPFGRDAVTEKASTVTVAVFVEDGDLPAVVPPFCCVVSRNWSAGRLKDQIARGIERFTRGVPAMTVAAYEVWWLNDATQGASTPVSRVTSDGAAAGTKSLATLTNGDVLLCGRPACASAGGGHTVNTTVQIEVDRMRALKGKEQAALRMSMMKQCAVM